MNANRIAIETPAAGRERITFWLNTPTYLAKEVVLEADKFSISRSANGSQLIESNGPVRLAGFTVAESINSTPFLQNAEHNVLVTWERGFRLQISADGIPQWFCCPR